MGIRAKSVGWNEELVDYLEKCVQTSEKNGAGLSYAAITNMYILAGIEVSEAAESSSEAAAIWARAIETSVGTREKAASKRSANTWASRRANASQLEADRAELAAVDKAHEAASARKTRRRGDVEPAAPGVIPEPKAEKKEKGKKSKGNA